MCIYDDGIFSNIFVDDDLLSLLEPNIFSNIFQRRFALSSKPCSISILSFISALNALDKALDACTSRYMHFLLVFDDTPPRHEKDLHLPSTKLDDSFHVNKKTFEISMKQS
jgi:hypothetical protein